MTAIGASASKLAALTIIICCATAVLSYCGEPGRELPARSTLNSPKYGAAKPSITALYPAKLPIALPTDQLNTLDFMTLSGCSLQITLGKYQSKLGRGASHSQRLLLDLEYLRLAPRCIDHKHASGKPELAAFLESVWQIKQQQLPSAIFNATLGNAEFHRFWRNPAVSGNLADQQQLTLSALQAINSLTRQWLSGDYRARNIEFEIHLSEIARGSIMLADGHDQKALQSIIQLEQLLTAALPPRYGVWQEGRDHYFSGLEPPTGLN